MRRRVLDALRTLHAFAVENSALPGTPDVNYVEGWIELKQLPKWPKVGEDRNILLPHFTPQQRLFMLQRHRHHGKVWLMLKVGRDEWFLFRGKVAAEHVGRCTRAQLIEHAARHWPKGLNEQELIACLT